MSENKEQETLNDLFHVLTWRSPLRTPSVRRVVSHIAGVMRASPDPGTRVTGFAIQAIVDMFEKKSKKKE